MSESKSTTVSGGLGLGTLIAVLASWTTWHSIGWCVLHGMLGWIYVIYWALFVTVPR